MSKAKSITVAEYLTQQINICGRSQKEISEDLGYDKPNIITMFKQGKTKLPINKVPGLAKSLGVDPVHFLRIVMSEYSPETWSVIDALVGRSLLSESEAVILDIVRTIAEGQAIGPETEEDAADIAALAIKWKDRADKNARAAAERVERERKAKTPH